MAQIFKQQSLIALLKERLALRLPALVISQAVDASGASLLLGSGVAGAQNIAIKVKAQDTQFNNSIGQAQDVFSPMIIQKIEEASTIAHVSLVNVANEAAIMAEVAKLGCKMECWLNAHGSAPALSQFQADGSVSGSTLEVELASDLMWPLSGQ